MSPWLTASAMYSKCIVSPLISTPIAIRASKGPDLLLSAAASEGSAVRSVVDAPSRSPAPSEDVVEDWTCEAAKSLRAG